jgi:hypothetical protein
MVCTGTTTKKAGFKNKLNCTAKRPEYRFSFYEWILITCSISGFQDVNRHLG